MKPIFVVLVFCIFSFLNIKCTSSFDEGSLKESIINIEQKLMDGVAAGDRGLWSAHMVDSCIITIEDGTRLTAQQFIGDLNPLPSSYTGTIKVTEPKFFAMDENTAAISYVADEHLELYGQHIHTQYAVTNTWINRGGWKLVAMQTFEILKNPTPIDLPIDVDELSGVYSLSEGIEYSIAVESGKLMGQRSGRTKEELFREAGNVYFSKNARVRKIFVKEGTRITKMLDRRSGNDIVWTKIG